MPAGALPSTRARTNVPASLTALVGREPLLVELARQLQATRLLTLTGGGGVGKTRLALETARAAIADFPDGVWLIELAGVTDPALVPRAVADVVRVRERPGSPLLDTLVAHLRDRRLLLILDNCEQLLDACARLADSLLRRCAGVQLLATSREALGIAGEIAWRVPSLAAPPPDLDQAAHVADYAAVQLFLDRARAASASFALTPSNAPAVAEICRRLDGIPLAIELAAARVTGLTPEQIAARLGDRFRLLTSGSRVAPRRQQTLLATVNWSYALLDEQERTVFNRLAVFASTFPMEAAEAVCSGDDIDPPAVLDLLVRLVDKSLIQVDEMGQAARYRLLETLRHFATERLVDSGEADRVQERHAAYFLNLAETLEPLTYPAESRDEAEDQLTRAQSDMRLALRWLHERGERERALRLAAALGNFWHRRGKFDEGRTWLALVLDNFHESKLETDVATGRARAQAQQGLGRFAYAQGDLSLAWAQFDENLAYFRAVDDGWEIGHSLLWLGGVAQLRGQFAVARRAFAEALDHFRATGDRTAICWALWNLGCLAIDAEDYAEAKRHLDEGLHLARSVGHPHEIACMLFGFGKLAYHQGVEDAGRADLTESARLYFLTDSSDSAAIAVTVLGQLEIDAGRLATAGIHLRQALTIHAELGDRPAAAEDLEGLARLAGHIGVPDLAIRLAGATTALRESLGTPLPPFWARKFDAAVATVRRALPAADAAAAWTAGRAMTLDDAIAAALACAVPANAAEETPPTVAALSRLSPLSAREGEVAVLVARGLTNRQIAAELAIGERTVGTHVTNILTKLGFATRAQIAAWTVEHAVASPEHA